MGKSLRFDIFYKRRVNRIYPSVWACVVVMLILGDVTFGTLTLTNFVGRDFIVAIMTYYAILWVVREKLNDKISWVFTATCMVMAVAYYFFPYKNETGSKGIYGITTAFRWMPYFGVMLMGAYCGKIRQQLTFKPKWDGLLCFICLVVFYSIQFAAKKIPSVGPWQILTVPFLFGIVFYFYKLCNAPALYRVYNTQWGNWIIMVVSGLCLESYLVQYCVITDKLNFLFPLNIPLIMIGTLILAYVTRCMARLFIQTFRTEDYEWSKVFSIK